MKNLRKIFSTETKSLSDERALLVTISTPTPDRMGDVVDPKGVDLKHFKRNPVVLWAHDYSQLPIGRATDIKATEEGITAKVQFPEKGTYAFADTVFELAQQDMINAWSIGFAPDYATTETLSSGGAKFNKSELLEFSAVPVPANPEALTMMKSAGVAVVKTLDDVELDDDDFSEAIEAPEQVVEPEEAPVEVEIPDKEEELTLEADDIEIDTDAKTMTITSAKGVSVYALNEGQINALKVKSAPVAEVEAEPEDTTRYIELTVESLKLADQAIGRALRDLKQRNTPKQS